MTPRSIRVRIVAAFVAALLAMLGVLAFLVWLQAGQARSLELVSDGYWPLANTVATLNLDRQRIDRDVDRVLAAVPRPGTGSASPAAIYSDRVRTALAQGHENVGYCRQLTKSAADLAKLNKLDSQLTLIEQLFQEYQSTSEDVIALATADPERARARAKDLEQAGKRLGDEIDKLELGVNGRVSEMIAETGAAQARATAIAVVLFLGTAGFVGTLILAVLAALSPITRLTEQVQRLAGGDYTGRVEVRGRDEVAVLANEFNAMVAAIRARDDALRQRAEDLDRVSGYLGSVLDSLEDALLVVENGRITLANPAARRIGAAEGGDPPDALRSAATQTGRAEIVVGPTRYEVRSQPLGDMGMIVVAADVTEQTRTREQLARSERLALVGQMLAQITHEIRNPLNALSLNAELLSEELVSLDPERRTEAHALLAVATREIERLTALTGHYLQLARRPRATLALDEPAAILHDVLRLLAAELEERKVTVETRFAPIPAVPVDGNQLRQAVLNLVRNAVESGARKLVLALSATDDDVTLSLADDGPGFPPDALEHLFDPFFSTKAKGTGLGLAITKQILEDHDGTVGIRSGPGGSVVTLTWPRRRPAVSDAVSEA